MKQAYEDILALRLSKAQKILSLEKTRDPQNVFVDYLENYSDFIRVFVSEDFNFFQIANKKFPERIQHISELPDSNPYKNLLLSNMNLQWAFARIKFGQYLRAAWEINKSYRLVISNHQRFPDFLPDEITLGALHVMIGLVPLQYHWMLKIISMKGSVEQGKKEIYHVLQTSGINPKYAYLKDEALFFLGFLELNLAPNQKALKKLEVQLNQADSNNMLLKYLKVDILMRHGKNEAALKILSNMGNRYNYYRFSYLDYLQGECLLRKLDLNAAFYFRKFIHNFKGTNYVKDAWRKLAWIDFLKGDTLGYFHTMDSVLVKGGDLVDADKQALLEAKSQKLPNSDLLHVRLLFDGGYYARAEKILNRMKGEKLLPEVSLERTYRYGRIADKEGWIPDAKTWYKRTLKEGENSPKYFAANASLMLGRMYESEDSLSLARQYYERCLNLNFDEYHNSICGEARESLKRIQNK
ncbi:MAG: hypothetical protein JXR31_05035 [Prolixibacteraceae bacterium]|nr:hypothetical protein [Prolixibacteraceae bacterium]